MTAKRGRAKKNTEHDAKQEADRKMLQSLKYFKCGSCQFLVTKHKWIDHFIDHGGLAWIEGFEKPITLTDWNEAVRRSIKNFKVFNQVVMICPNCRQEKRSVIGHLTHLLVCCESDKAIDLKKIPCEYCSEKFLPGGGTAHRSKCSGFKTIQADNDGDDEVESSSEEEIVNEETLNSSGRTKRKAVKR